MLRVACLLTCLTLAWILGCDDNGANQRAEEEKSLSLLHDIDGCDDVEKVVRERIREQMRSVVMENYHAVLEGRGCYRYTWADGDSDTDTDTDTDGDGEVGPDQFSTTNTQEGLDEADFVKTDGELIFIASGSELIVVDGMPAPEAHVVTQVELEGIARRLYVHGDHAIVYSDLVEDEPQLRLDDCYLDAFSGERICGAALQKTLITVLDMSDLEQPVVERMIELSGVYMDSHRIDDVIYTVMFFPDFGLADFSYCPDNVHLDPSDQAAIWRAFSEVITANDELIENTPFEGWVPTVTDTRFASDGTATASSDPIAGCDGFYDATIEAGRSMLSIVSFDTVGEAEDIEASSVIGDQGVVYASRDALYLSSRHDYRGIGQWYFDDVEEISEATTVHRFAIDNESSATIYEASGVVPGRVLNQFSMGEQEGLLRIATTLGHLPDPDASNNIFVLQNVDGVLEIVGELTGIAPSEDIRSARFIGDRGFVVTFNRTDPLFTLDLSNPEDPRVVGELHIPGFSTYMHMMDREHLLTIGFDAEDYDNFALFQGVQLQIFDVSVMSNPVRSHIEVIGNIGTTSEAMSHLLTFNYFDLDDLLAIPMAICEEGPGGPYDMEMTFNGLLVYDVTVASGFQEHGRISHGDPPLGYDCTNWWMDSSVHVKRSILMDDALFSIASDVIHIADRSDLSIIMNTIEL